MNSCVEVQEKYPDYVDFASVQFFFGTIYSLILLFGLVGNSLVLYGLTFGQVEFNVRQVFIWNLTIADLIIGLVTLPVSAIHTFVRQWYFGAFLCHFFPLVQGISTFAISLTLVAIAYDRYVLAKFPKRLL